jgi:hypothetical protein
MCIAMNRSIGVKILSGLQLLYGGFGFSESLALRFSKSFRDYFIQETFMKMLKASPELLTYIPITADSFEEGTKLGAAGGIVLGLFGLLLGYCLLKLKKWAWICTLIFHVLQILVGLYGSLDVLSGRAVLGILILSQNIFLFIVSVVIVYHLFRSEVKQAFSR